MFAFKCELEILRLNVVFVTCEWVDSDKDSSLFKIVSVTRCSAQMRSCYSPGDV